MQNHLTAPWSQPDGNLSKKQTRTYEIPDMPGRFPVEVQELPPVASVQIHELPGSVPDGFSTGLSNLSGPFDSQMPPSAFIEAQDNLNDVPPQQPKSHDADANTGNLDSNSALLGFVSSTLNAEPEEGPKVNSRDSSKPKPRQVPKTGPKKPSNDIVIAVFGKTGTGKSSFISTLTGKDVKVGYNLQSCTSEIEEVQFKVGLCNVTLVDTPGFDDTDRSDAEILTLIASWMKDAYEEKTRLTGVIYLHRISDNRMSGSSYKNLKLFRSLCGMRNISNVILATTMWDKVTQDEGAARERDLLSDGRFWGSMKNAGAMVRRYDNTTGGALTLVNELLQLSPIVLKIQHEIMVQRKDLIDTDAGRSISADLRDLTKKHEEEMAQIKEDLLKALKEKDDEAQKELEDYKKQVAEKIKEVEKSQAALRSPINKKSWFRTTWKCKNKRCNERLSKPRGQKETGRCPLCNTVQRFVD